MTRYDLRYEVRERVYHKIWEQEDKCPSVREEVGRDVRNTVTYVFCKPLDTVLNEAARLVTSSANSRVDAQGVSRD